MAFSHKDEVAFINIKKKLGKLILYWSSSIFLKKLIRIERVEDTYATNRFFNRVMRAKRLFDEWMEGFSCLMFLGNHWKMNKFGAPKCKEIGNKHFQTNPLLWTSSSLEGNRAWHNYWYKTIENRGFPGRPPRLSRTKWVCFVSWN